MTYFHRKRLVRLHSNLSFPKIDAQLFHSRSQRTWIYPENLTSATGAMDLTTRELENALYMVFYQRIKFQRFFCRHTFR